MIDWWEGGGRKGEDVEHPKAWRLSFQKDEVGIFWDDSVLRSLERHQETVLDMEWLNYTEVLSDTEFKEEAEAGK